MSIQTKVKQWASSSGKPDQVTEDISSIQNEIGSSNFAKRWKINQVYKEQLKQWFLLPNKTTYTEGDVTFTGSVPKLMKAKKGHTKITNATGVMVFDTYGNNENIGHWFFAIQRQHVPLWFLKSQTFQNWKETVPTWNLTKPNDIIMFGHTKNYFQPWGTNQWCQAIAVLFALAFREGYKSKWAKTILALTPVDQDKSENKYVDTAWGQKTTLVKSWIGDEPDRITNALLASEVENFTIFTKNWLQVYKALYHLLYSRYLITKYNRIGLYVEKSQHNLRNCTFDK